MSANNPSGPPRESLDSLLEQARGDFLSPSQLDSLSDSLSFIAPPTTPPVPRVGGSGAAPRSIGATASKGIVAKVILGSALGLLVAGAITAGIIVSGESDQTPAHQGALVEAPEQTDDAAGRGSKIEANPAKTEQFEIDEEAGADDIETPRKRRAPRKRAVTERLFGVGPS